jgi:hypothetical protein
MKAMEMKNHITLSVKAWWIIILCAGYLVVNPMKVVDLIPASEWLEVDSIFVYNGPPDTDYVLMDVDRDIKRPFAADWIVELEAKRGNRYALVCARRGSNDYSTDAVLPAHLSLSWWMNSDTCIIPSGTYRIVTRWDLNIGSGKVVRKKSNDFNIR